MSLPFFDALQQLFPQNRVDIIAKEAIESVFWHHPVIHTIHTFSKSQNRGLYGLFRYGWHLKKYRAYDVFFTLAPSFSSALMGYATGSPIRVGYEGESRSILLTHRVPETTGIHRAQSYYDLLRHFCREAQQANESFAKVHLPAELPRTLMFPFSGQENQTQGFSKQSNTEYIVFNVNSEAQSRRLPPGKWVELANRLLSDDSSRRKILFIGTASERYRVVEVLQHLNYPDALRDLSGKTTVRELALILRDADVVVSNDSGPMHLANAVGTPVITFFGAGNSFETGPFNTDNAIILNKHIACSPCVKNACRFPTVRCLEQITVDEIYHSIRQVLRHSSQS